MPFFIFVSRLFPVFIAFFAASFMSFIDFCSSVGLEREGEKRETEQGKRGREWSGKEGKKRKEERGMEEERGRERVGVGVIQPNDVPHS